MSMSPEHAEPDRVSADLATRLSNAAWTACANARILGATRVGCAVLANNGDIYHGCNVEHRFRSHDIHAETNALASVVAGGATSCSHILVVAERDLFTPCGACMDWIFEIGGTRCQVGFQPAPDAPIKWFTATQLMPHYPY